MTELPEARHEGTVWQGSIVGVGIDRVADWDAFKYRVPYADASTLIHSVLYCERTLSEPAVSRNRTFDSLYLQWSIWLD